MRTRLRGSGGQAVPLAAGLVAVVAVATVAFGSVARDVVDAARAQTAADAAALAALEGGRPAAVQLAARHGGSLEGWSSRLGRTAVITVTVRVGEAVRTARAEGGLVLRED